MKNYIFLNTTIANVGGAEIYISHKCDHLKELGYNVFVFSIEPGKIVINNLREYEKYLVPEMKVLFRRSNKKIRKTVLDAFLRLQLKGEIIIESNVDFLNPWGEYIAQKIGAYHICYLLPESASHVKSDADFYRLKYEQHQLFAIKDVVINQLFNDKDNYSKARLVAVGCNVGAVDENNSIEIENYKSADYNILSLGRLNKPYIQSLIDGVEQFSKLNSQSSVNLLVVGGYMNAFTENRLNELNRRANVKVYILGELNPIPHNIFNLCDCAIATAGCAWICDRQGLPTITIDANDLQGIGILKHTTEQALYRQDEPQTPVELLLQNVLVDQIYPKKPPIKEPQNIDYTLHDQLLQIPGSYKYYEVSYKPDSLLALIVKLLIIVLGSQRYFKLIKVIKK